MWRNGLKRLPDGETARNVILPDEMVRALVRTAYEIDLKLGLWVEVLAETGSRESQVARAEVQDLQDDVTAPRLMMPSSKKGRNRRIERKALPISPRLAAVLRQQAVGRASYEPLLGRVSAKLCNPFKAVVERLGLDDKVTPYVLRHSSIVRQLLNGVPVRIVASHHDTSVAMIEKHYSRFIIGDPSEALTRRTLLDFSAPAAVDNVVLNAARAI